MSEKISGTNYRIFSLGTNNWQSKEEPAPGSGILHKTHHDIFNQMKGVESYSIWPSKTQRYSNQGLGFKVFELDHDIPICESYSPNSNYRWHSMSNEEINKYFFNLKNKSLEYIKEIEDKKGTISMFLAHHTFVNPLIIQKINEEREVSGKKKIPLAVFAHGTAMKMYDNELRGEKDFPMKFYDWVLKTGIFGSGKNKANVVFTISNEEKKNFLRLFPKYNPEDVIVSGNGFNTQYFKHFSERPSLSNALEGILNVVDGKPLDDLSKYDKSIVFTGKFADWKRLDSVLLAAKSYENVLRDTKGLEVATIIAGTGPDKKTRNFYYDLAKNFGLKNTFFIGSQDQPTLAKINNAVDLGVYPSKDEPFGLVIIECMACGTPVIGANSGGPRDYVKPEFGSLIPETENKITFAQNLSSEIQKALIEDWKKIKGPNAAKYAHKNFTPEAQCNQIINEVKKRSK